jgi:hypothetical protein
MDDIIQTIINSEKMAQIVVNEAREERLYHETRLRSEIEAYQAKVTLDNKVRIESFNALQARDADAGVKHIEDAAKLKIVRLQQRAAQNKADWAGYLYEKILDGEIG